MSESKASPQKPRDYKNTCKEWFVPINPPKATAKDDLLPIEYLLYLLLKALNNGVIAFGDPSAALEALEKCLKQLKMRRAKQPKEMLLKFQEVVKTIIVLDTEKLDALLKKINSRDSVAAVSPIDVSKIPEPLTDLVFFETGIQMLRWQCQQKQTPPQGEQTLLGKMFQGGVLSYPNLQIVSKHYPAWCRGGGLDALKEFLATTSILELERGRRLCEEDAAAASGDRESKETANPVNAYIHDYFRHVVDLRQLLPPAEKPLDENSQVAVGDLHSNLLLAWQSMHHEGIIQNTDVFDFAALVGSYERHDAQLNKAWQLWLSGKDPEKLGTIKQQLQRDIAAFKSILGKVSFNAKIKFLLWVGDETNDRGANDLFIWLLLEQLATQKVPLKILSSNHGMDGLIQLLFAFDPNSPTEKQEAQKFSLNTGMLGAEFRRSQINLFKWLALEIDPSIDLEEIRKIVREIYIPSLELFDYAWSDDGEFILGSHAPVGWEAVEAAAAYYGISNTTVASSPEKAALIDKINAVFKADISTDQFFERYKLERELDALCGKSHDQSLQIVNTIKGLGVSLPEDYVSPKPLPSVSPLQYIWWNRSAETIQLPEDQKGFSTYHGHSHSGVALKPNMVNLDGLLGKSSKHLMGRLPLHRIAPKPELKMHFAPPSKLSPTGRVPEYLNSVKHFEKLKDKLDVLNKYNSFLDDANKKLKQVEKLAKERQNSLAQLLLLQIELARDAVASYLLENENAQIKDSKTAGEYFENAKALNRSLLVKQSSNLRILGAGLFVTGVAAYIRWGMKHFAAVAVLPTAILLSVSFLSGLVMMKNGPYPPQPLGISLLLGTTAVALYWGLAISFKPLPMGLGLILLNLSMLAGATLFYYKKPDRLVKQNFVAAMKEVEAQKPAADSSARFFSSSATSSIPDSGPDPKNGKESAVEKGPKKSK